MNRTMCVIPPQAAGSPDRFHDRASPPRIGEPAAALAATLVTPVRFELLGDVASEYRAGALRAGPGPPAPPPTASAGSRSPARSSSASRSWAPTTATDRPARRAASGRRPGARRAGDAPRAASLPQPSPASGCAVRRGRRPAARRVRARSSPRSELGCVAMPRNDGCWANVLDDCRGLLTGDHTISVAVWPGVTGQQNRRGRLGQHVDVRGDRSPRTARPTEDSPTTDETDPLRLSQRRDERPRHDCGPVGSGDRRVHRRAREPTAHAAHELGSAYDRG